MNPENKNQTLIQRRLDKLIELSKKARYYQKEYFRCRTMNLLKLAKESEKTLDKYLKTLDNEINSGQIQMFNE